MSCLCHCCSASTASTPRSPASICGPRVDPTRDTLLADSTPIDYLDFASPVSGLGSKMGLDATNKWPGETSREWGRPLTMSAEITAKVEQVWQTLGL